MEVPILDYLGLKAMPFDERPAEKAEQIFQSKDLTQTVKLVERVSCLPGVCLLCADPGKGLSYAVHAALKSTLHGRKTVRHFSVMHMTERDFYKETCRLTEASPVGKGRGALIHGIRERAKQLMEQGKPLFLVLDHAENLPPEVMKDLVSLISGEFGLGSIMTVLLCGSKDLKWILTNLQDDRILFSLRGNYTFGGLSQEETTKYIQQQFRCAGAENPLINEEALEQVYATSAFGNYKLLNQTMQEALYLCFQTKRKCIDRQVLAAAVSRQNLT